MGVSSGINFHPVTKPPLTDKPLEEEENKPRSRRNSAQEDTSILDCNCGCGYTSMWLNHFDREEKMNDKRRNKANQNQNRILSHPEIYGANSNEVRKDKLISSFVKDGYGNSLLTDMGG
jgi:hypothetical protein